MAPLRFKMRTACYIDGFNLYHAIDALNDPSLKWTDLRSLAGSYVRDGDSLERVAFFTALNTWDAGKRGRHVNYINALEATGVDVIKSNFDRVNKWCYTHERWCKLREEKQTDVSIAIEMLSDCYSNAIERVLLITSDSDQVPAVKAIRARFESVVVLLVAPPKRLTVARELGKTCSGITELTAGKIRQHPMPIDVRDKRGRLVASRPAAYGDRFQLPVAYVLTETADI